MKLIMLASILTFSLITSMNVDGHIWSSEEKNDLIELKEIANSHQIEITTWSAFQRKQIGKYENVEEMKNKIEKIMEENKDFTWKQVINEENHHYVWEGIKKQTNNNMVEKLKLKSYHSNTYYSVGMTYQLSGSQLGEGALQLIEKTFKNENNVFYSLTGKAKTTKNIETLANNLISDMKATPVEQIKEKSFVSLSAYTKMFNSELKTKDKEKINVQIGLRAGEEIDVTIGTPIITTEY